MFSHKGLGMPVTTRLRIFKEIVWTMHLCSTEGKFPIEPILISTLVLARDSNLFDPSDLVRSFSGFSRSRSLYLLDIPMLLSK